MRTISVVILIIYLGLLHAIIHIKFADLDRSISIIEELVR